MVSMRDAAASLRTYIKFSVRSLNHVGGGGILPASNPNFLSLPREVPILGKVGVLPRQNRVFCPKWANNSHSGDKSMRACWKHPSVCLCIHYITIQESPAGVWNSNNITDYDVCKCIDLCLCKFPHQISLHCGGLRIPNFTCEDS